MILVTGASGPLGQSVVSSLLSKGVSPDHLTVLVRSEEKGASFQAQGIAVAIGDYANYDSLVQAFEGVDQLLFISSSDLAQRALQHENVVNAAKATGVKHVVYTSFQGKTETAESPLWMVAESHLLTEKWLKESGMAYTILKNNLYLDFIPGFLGEKVLETQTIFVPAGNGLVGAVLRAELAEATAQVLVESGHENQTYQFTHESPFSYEEVATYLSSLTGKEIAYVSPTFEEYAETLTSFGVPAEVIGIFGGFAVAQAQGELERSSGDVTRFLGRKPTTVFAFLDQVYGG